MKASKFTDAQKAFILKQGADGHPVAEIGRKAGISEATYFNIGQITPILLHNSGGASGPSPAREAENSGLG
jgi:hypothetical protein